MSDGLSGRPSVHVRTGRRQNLGGEIAGGGGLEPLAAPGKTISHNVLAHWPSSRRGELAHVEVEDFGPSFCVLVTADLEAPVEEHKLGHVDDIYSRPASRLAVAAVPQQKVDALLQRAQGLF